jgi:hypothetical protein
MQTKKKKRGPFDFDEYGRPHNLNSNLFCGAETAVDRIILNILKIPITPFSAQYRKIMPDSDQSKKSAPNSGAILATTNAMVPEFHSILCKIKNISYRTIID